MQALTSLLPSIASIGSGAGGLFEQYKNQQYQDQLRSYAENPAKFNAYARQFVQPLNAGLTAGVNNQAQGYAAERGLAQSPALQQQIESQAIAPYIQQNTDQGYQMALNALGLGGGAQPQQGNPLAQLSSGLAGLGSNPYLTLAKIQNQSSQPAPGLDPTSVDPGYTIPDTPQTSWGDWYSGNFATA